VRSLYMRFLWLVYLQYAHEYTLRPLSNHHRHLRYPSPPPQIPTRMLATRPASSASAEHGGEVAEETELLSRLQQSGVFRDPR
jgi:hypothetical protein